MSETQDAAPEEVWEQDVAEGGSVAGQLPTAAGAVVVQGVTVVRDAPALGATFGLMTIPQGTAQRIGRNSRRRRLIVSSRPNTTATAYVVLADTNQQAIGGYGLPILQGANPLPLQYAGEVWIAAFGADMQVGFIAELDG